MRRSEELAAVMKRFIRAYENQDPDTLRGLLSQSEEFLIIGSAPDEWLYGLEAHEVVAATSRPDAEWLSNDRAPPRRVRGGNGRLGCRGHDGRVARRTHDGAAPFGRAPAGAGCLANDAHAHLDDHPRGGAVGSRDADQPQPDSELPRRGGAARPAGPLQDCDRDTALQRHRGLDRARRRGGRRGVGRRRRSPFQGSASDRRRQRRGRHQDDGPTEPCSPSNLLAMPLPLHRPSSARSKPRTQSSRSGFESASTPAMPCEPARTTWARPSTRRPASLRRPRAARCWSATSSAAWSTEPLVCVRRAFEPVAQGPARYARRLRVGHRGRHRLQLLAGRDSRTPVVRSGAHRTYRV